VSTELVIDGREDALAPALALLSERLDDPRLDPAEARARIEELLLRRQEGRTSKDVRGSALDRTVLKGAASEFRDGAPAAEALRALAGAPLGPVVERLRALPLTACATGGAAVAAAVPGFWRGGQMVPPDPPVRYLRPAGDAVVLCHQAGAQARVALLSPGAPIPEEEDAARRVWDEILGGAANLFFQEVREARGLAYSTRGRVERGRRPVDDSVLWALTMCDGGRAAEVAALMVRLLRDPAPIEARFERARSALLARDAAHRIRPRAVAGTVAAWRRYGLVGDPRPARRAALGALTLDDVLALQARCATRPLTLSVLGDLGTVDRGALAELGPVSVLETVDLFSY
jgi:predicted Zn-dependent peptidase